MGWQLTEDVEEFRTAADPCLVRDPARSTLLLTISESIRESIRVNGAAVPARFGYWRENETAPVSAGFVQTPPLRPLLGPMPDRAARELVPVLRAAQPGADHTRATAERVSTGRIWLWDVAGAPVAMASVSPVVAGQARVAPVYTPPRLRGRGYGGAVTAAVSRATLDAGAEQVLLYTDLANPTSNALYRRLGYRPLTDSQTLTFG
ncbi:GNAT family N-acetyltransferase [Streptomyces niveus]|uniref:GNAT family N-acetyltransferase n=1 Tax=Streptomyces niveus TaxID=193462 RepID=UPI0035D9D601